jgi:hypothetical protein
MAVVPVPSKLWWQSRTLWVAFVSFVAAAIQSKYGWVVSPEYQAYALTVVVTVLRFLTKQPVSLN